MVQDEDKKRLLMLFGMLLALVVIGTDSILGNDITSRGFVLFAGIVSLCWIILVAFTLSKEGRRVTGLWSLIVLLTIAYAVMQLNLLRSDWQRNAVELFALIVIVLLLFRLPSILTALKKTQ